MNDLGWEYSLPNQWKVLEVRRLLRQGSAGIKIGPFGSELRLSDLSDSGERVYGQANVIARDFTLGKRFVSGPKLSELSAYRVSPGDILVTMMGTSGRCASVPVGAEPGIMDSHLLRLRFQDNEVDPRFAVWALGESRVVREQFVVLGRGSIMHGLNSGIVKSVRLPVPSLLEQWAIADFLDRKTKVIDDLIQKKEQLIERLQEKRQALIIQTVTKGLAPTVPMKDSGIEWLGEIPAHWECVKLAYICESIQTGPFGSQLHASDYTEGGIPIINPANIMAGRVIADATKSVTAETFARLKRHELWEGDIVFGRRGEMGRCGLVTANERGWLCGTGSLRVRLQMERCQPAFAVNFLSTPRIKENLGLESVGSTMDNLNTSILGRLPIALPPHTEQAIIVRHICRATEQIDQLVHAVLQQIDRLREYRQALISAAVTGKIDVKETSSVASDQAACTEDNTA